jgi:uncharacterized SAM-binding protein YcdF (DUF218 family)
VNPAALRRFEPAARRIIAVYGLALAIILYSPVTDWAAYPLLPTANIPSGDVIVVLSAWANVNGELNESGLRRAIAAARLYRHGVARRIVVTGGRPIEDDQGDALQASVHFLADLGIPPAAIMLEDRSTNTHDSAVNVARLARARGWSRVVIVTDAVHLLRTRLAFAHEQLSVSYEPAMTWMIEGDQPSIRLAKLDAIAHEYGGLLYYRLRGWI